MQSDVSLSNANVISAKKLKMCHIVRGNIFSNFFTSEK